MGNVILIYTLVSCAGILFLVLGLKWRWIYLAVLVPSFIIPGFLKLIDAHFVTNIPVECKKMCELSPVDTAFYFFGYSRLFIRTAGFIQLTGGLLLIFKKFRFVGLLNCLVISSYINLINFSFWGLSNVTLYMLTISLAICLYLAKDYSRKLKLLTGE